MSDSSNAAAANEEFETEEYTKPEEFLFFVEDNDGIIATICPEQYFNEENFLDDQYYGTISELLNDNDFFEIMEATYEYDVPGATVEMARQKLVSLGFKRTDEFDKFMTDHATQSPPSADLSGDGSERGLGDLIDEQDENSEI